MKSLINRRGSKATTRAMKRFGTGSANRTRPSVAKTTEPEKPSCKTSDKVAACNCCEDYEFYTPEGTKSDAAMKKGQL